MLVRTQLRMNSRNRKSAGEVAQRVTLLPFILTFVFLPADYVAAQVQANTRPASDNVTTNSGTPGGVSLQTSFEVKFKAFDNVYLSAEPGAALVKGMKLIVKRPSKAQRSDDAIVAELEVKSVSPTSIICEVSSKEGDVERGDIAYLTQDEIAALTKAQLVRTAKGQAPAVTPPSNQLEPKVATAAPLSPEPARKSPIGVVEITASAQLPTPQSTSDLHQNADSKSNDTLASATNSGTPGGVSLQTFFEVKLKAFDNVYLKAEPGAALVKGMKLIVKRPSKAQRSDDAIVAELEVKSVSPTSIICEVSSKEGDVERGDIAYLTQDEIAALTKAQLVRTAKDQAPAVTPPSSQLGPKVATAAPLSPEPVRKGPIGVMQSTASTQEPSPQSEGRIHQNVESKSNATLASAIPPPATQQTTSLTQMASSASESRGLSSASDNGKDQVSSTISTVKPSPTATQVSGSVRQLATAQASPKAESVILAQAQQTPSATQTNPPILSSEARQAPTTSKDLKSVQTPSAVQSSATTQVSASATTNLANPAAAQVLKGEPLTVAAQAKESLSVTQPNPSTSSSGATQVPQTALGAKSAQTAPVVPPSSSTPVSSSAPTGTANAIEAPAANSGSGQQVQAGIESTSPDQEIAKLPEDGSLADVQTIFKIKFVAQDTVYLSAGTATGLTAGMKLIVKHSEADITEKGTLAKASQAPTIAQLEVISVASSSAVCAVQNKTADIKPGDLAFMNQTTAEMLAEKRALSASRKYPQVVSFNEGDPLDEEVRDEVPRPPLPEVNRIRGRFGFDYGSINSVGSVGSNNSQVGMVVRTDFTRIGGTYWNLSGYWRGRLTNTSYTEQPTLQDLINRTYHLNLSYSSPTSPWVAGFGRLYLPWATSLDTIDGGYVGRKEGKHVLLGIFAGSTPDPTSWDYNPDRRIGGVFLNLEGGSFDSVRITSTSGLALSTLLWQVDRPFIFFENGFYVKRYLAIYDSTQADDPRPIPGLTAAGPGLSRNFFTLRFQPFERLSFDVNDNYFRDVPTFDTSLIATGLLDKYLFQGISTGARVEPIKHITFYASVGKSSRTGDTSSSWNEMYGVTFARIPWAGLRLDARASTFDSSFGNGNYRAVSLSRNVHEALRIEVQAGEQSLASLLSNQTNSHFVNATLDGNLGSNYFVQGAYTIQRGGTFNYNQWTVTFGYRFDNRTSGIGQ